jgi:hypothetical protein
MLDSCVLDSRTKNSTTRISTRSDKESLWVDICNEIFAMHQQQQAVITGDKLQNHEQTITAVSALPTTKAKSISRALAVANFFCGDSSSDEENLEHQKK